MGFARLLRFKMDGILAKLAHYVVDKFNPEEMEIRVPCGSIKIDSEVIHQLLGLLKGGVSFSSLVELDIMDEGVSRWKNRYPGRFISPTKMVDNIEASDDVDSFEFQIDFLMCFVTVMVDCHYQGFLREWILDYIMEQTNFKDLDWCGFVVEKMKECKYNSKICNVNSTFAGPLAILTVDPKVNPLMFWNISNLKERQKLEIKGGGFGIGPFKGLSSSTNTEGKLYLEYPEDEDILSLKSKYETMPEDKPLWHTITKEKIIIAKDQISNVLKGVNLKKGESSSNEQREEEDQDTEIVAREADVEKEIEGNRQIRESEENVEIEKTDMMESNICGSRN
ncbi:hypothetical protein L1987_48179 [Smallanthus sonchifolius]|uniref:Uncharacterized protein n=1 Tax=Smallanthus sonchifolius TaxID=185202 RepID=A0ACB9FQM0_9ASTR|nr:hypothetical protein L1987_48179 [Smallanthus sonchifolius]